MQHFHVKIHFTIQYEEPHTTWFSSGDNIVVDGMMRLMDTNGTEICVWIPPILALRLSLALRLASSEMKYTKRVSINSQFFHWYAVRILTLRKHEK